MASINHQYRTIEIKLPNFLKIFFSKDANRSNWVYELKSALHFNEMTLQQVITYKIQEHLPDYDIIYYNKKITSSINRTISNKPDFLMWKKDYTDWYIIEVELENHGIHHIKQQISTFYDGDYSDVKGISEYVANKFSNLDKTKFENLIRSNRPKIMLIADHVKPEWKTEFSKYNCLLSSLQIYCDDKENFTYRFNGDWPQEYKKYSFCTLDKRLRSLNISSPNFLNNLGINSGDKITLYYQSIGEYWEYLFDNGAESLLFSGTSLSLDITQSRWKLIQNNKGQFHLLKA